MNKNVIMAVTLIVFTSAVSIAIAILTNNCVLIHERANYYCDQTFGNCTKIVATKNGFCAFESGFRTSQGIQIVRCNIWRCWHE